MSVGVGIAGCCGRMGRAIATLALEDSMFAVRGALEAPGHAALGQDYGTFLGLPKPLGVAVVDDAAAAMRPADVVIDFTLPEATLAHVGVARQLRKAIVIGTTGLTPPQMEAIRDAAKSIAVVVSPNMSAGVNVLMELARTAAERLRGFDVEVVESHHRHKKDAPSGTAKRLAEVLARARGQSAEQIPVHAVRAGDIVGDHTVILAGPSERLEITHRAHSREVFARGALRAAQFVQGRAPGLYDMTDVLAART